MPDDASAWMLVITIPSEAFDRGPGRYAYVNNTASSTFNFYAELYSAALDTSTGTLLDVWLEAVMDAEKSFLTIHEVCEPCSLDAIECSACRFAFDITWYAMRAKLNS